MRLNLVCTVGPVPSVSRDPFGDHRALPVGDLESRELQANSLFQAKFRIVFGLLHSVLPLHRPSRGRRTRQGNLDTRTWSFLLNGLTRSNTLNINTRPRTYTTTISNVPVGNSASRTMITNSSNVRGTNS